MKKTLITASILLSTLSASANAYLYYNNPTYCRTEWNCQVISKDFWVAR